MEVAAVEVPEANPAVPVLSFDEGTTYINAPPGATSHQMGIEQHIKQRELDAIQQNVVVAATKALEAFGPEQCLGMACGGRASDLCRLFRLWRLRLH